MMNPARLIRLSSALLLLLPLPFTMPAQALKPLTTYPATPSDYGIVHDVVSFQAADGLTLKGWFYPAQDTVGIANDLVGRVVPVPAELRCAARPYATIDSAPRPTIILCGGDAGNMTFLIFYAYHFFTRGFNVFTFDWRGFGESDAWVSDRDQLCYTEFLLDYDAAIDLVQGRAEVDSARIALMGFSTGAYLSFAMIAKRTDIAAYAGRALLTSFDDLTPLLAELDPDRNFHAPADYPTDLLPIHAAEKVWIPAFLIVGENDERTPPWMSRKVFAKLKGPKELWVVPGAEHGGRSGPEFITYPEFFDRVTAFFDEHLKREP